MIKLMPLPLHHPSQQPPHHSSPARGSRMESTPVPVESSAPGAVPVEPYAPEALKLFLWQFLVF